jgi:hypothetical protein
MPNGVNRMKFTEVASRITGFSIPLFGVSWQPPVSDVGAAKKLIAFLEDRRVLYSPYEVEIVDHIFMSVIEIRHFLTDILTAGGIGKELEDHVRALRGACRAFMSNDTKHGRYANYTSGLQNFKLNQELGEFRRTVGFHVAALSTRYGINIEDDLASILPSPIE